MPPARMMPDGVTRAIDVARRNGVSYSAFQVRIHRGWPVERAAMTPPIDRGERIRQYSHFRGQSPKKSMHRQNAAMRRAQGFRLVGRIPKNRTPFGTQDSGTRDLFSSASHTPTGAQPERPRRLFDIPTQVEQDLAELI